MELNRLITAMGADRATQVANLEMAPQLWAGYERLHAEQFRNAGLKKYLALNSAGDILASNDTPFTALADVTNATTLRHEDFLVIRDEVLRVRRRELHGIQDLKDAGVSFSVSLGEQLVGFEKINEFAEAGQDMNPRNYQNNDTVFAEDFVPNPITHQSFNVPWRQQGFDYKRSLGIEEATRQVSERLEETLFNGNTTIVVTFNSVAYPIFGYTTHPDRGTGTITDWTLEANRDNIIPELIDEIGAMWSTQGGVANDSVMVYVANDIWNVFQKDYITAFPSDRIAARAKEVAQVKDIKPAEKLASGQVVLVEMARRSVELAEASDVIAVPHIKTSPMEPQVVTVYGAMVQQIKVDTNSNTGIRHLTT